MTNEEARDLLMQISDWIYEKTLGIGVDYYDALELAIDALNEVIKLERDPLDTFAPENQTDLRGPEVKEDTE